MGELAKVHGLNFWPVYRAYLKARFIDRKRNVRFERRIGQLWGFRSYFVYWDAPAHDMKETPHG